MENLSILSLFLFFLLAISLIYFLYSILSHIKTKTLFLEFFPLISSKKDEENSSNFDENSNETQKKSPFTKKTLIIYFAKRTFFMYNSLFSLLFFWLKDRNYRILPLKSHFFFMFLACFDYFTILTIIFSYKNSQFLIWFAFLLSFFIASYLFGLIKVFSSYFLLEFKPKTKKNGENKRNSSVFYIENERKSGFSDKKLEFFERKPIFSFDKNSVFSEICLFFFSLVFPLFCGFSRFLRFSSVLLIWMMFYSCFSFVLSSIFS